MIICMIHLYRFLDYYFWFTAFNIYSKGVVTEIDNYAYKITGYNFVIWSSHWRVVPFAGVAICYISIIPIKYVEL